MNRDRLLKAHLRERFFVTLSSGETFSGLLDEWDQNHLVLLDARALTETGSDEVSGKLFLPRALVRYMQRPA